MLNNNLLADSIEFIRLPESCYQISIEFECGHFDATLRLWLNKWMSPMKSTCHNWRRWCRRRSGCHFMLMTGKIITCHKKKIYIYYILLAIIDTMVTIRFLFRLLDIDIIRTLYSYISKCNSFTIPSIWCYNSIEGRLLYTYIFVNSDRKKNVEWTLIIRQLLSIAI